MAATPRDRLNELRADALRLLTSSSRKVARMRRENNIDISGTNLDPRMSRGQVPITRQQINKYNARQLQSAVNRMQNFTHRNTQYYGVGNDIVTGAQWRAYKRSERRMNRARAKQFDAVRDIKTPQGFTVGEYVDATHRVNRFVRDGTKPGEKVNLKPSQFASREALELAIKANERKARAGMSGVELGEHRGTRAMLARLDTKLAERFDRLTPQQQYALVVGTNISGGLSFRYDSLNSPAVLQSDTDQEIEQAYIDETSKLISWAGRLKIG